MSIHTQILLVEDEPDIVEELTSFLEEEGFSVVSANGQKAALQIMQEQIIDLVLLDITLKEGNGFSLCSAIKSEYSVPVIFLSALGDEFSTVTGLELGADDYIAKPFRPRELISRIKNVLRRQTKKENIKIGSLTIDTKKAIVLKDQQEVILSALEYKLLLVFLNNRERIVTRDLLVEEIYNISGEFIQDNTLTVYIKRLREKIEDDPKNPQILKTVRGIGYRMD